MQHIRFANQSIGYAYGPDALYMTTDGGTNWVRQAGMGADALETLSGNVVPRSRSGRLPESVLDRRDGDDRHNTWTPFTVPSEVT